MLKVDCQPSSTSSHVCVAAAYPAVSCFMSNLETYSMLAANETGPSHPSLSVRGNTPKKCKFLQYLGCSSQPYVSPCVTGECDWTKLSGKKGMQNPEPDAVLTCCWERFAVSGPLYQLHLNLADTTALLSASLTCHTKAKQPYACYVGRPVSLLCNLSA